MLRKIILDSNKSHSSTLTDAGGKLTTRSLKQNDKNVVVFPRNVLRARDVFIKKISCRENLRNECDDGK